MGVHFDICRRANLPANSTRQWEHSHPCLPQSQPEMCQESYIKPATYSPTPIWGPRICSTPRASWASLDRATRGRNAAGRERGILGRGHRRKGLGGTGTSTSRREAPPAPGRRPHNRISPVPVARLEADAGKPRV